MNKLIIYDLDGTLIDSREDLTISVNLMRKHYGLSLLSVDTVTSYIGNGVNKLVSRSLKEANIDMEEALTHLKRFYRENMLNQTGFYPAVEEGLHILHDAGWVQAVITNKPAALAKVILTQLGIHELFTHIIGGNSEIPLKPDPAGILSVVEETCSDINATWMMGDNYTDLEAGRRAKVKRCFAAYGFGNPKEEEYEMQVTSFTEFVSRMTED